MDSPEPMPPGVDAPDWKLLRALFPPDEGFRHKMGLQRRDFQEFYAPTLQGALLRQEKSIVLGDGPSEYVVACEAGKPAFREFAALLGQEADDGADALTATKLLSLHAEPDFLLMLPPDWTLGWATVCFPSHWSLAGKLGRPLNEIHAAVPGLNEELGRKITTFFTRMVPGEGWGRANWGLSASPNRNQHPSLPTPLLRATSDAAQTFVRIEDQHLLKLPRTGAMAFGIRVFNFRLTEVAADDAILSSLRQKLRSLPPEVAAYKGLTDFLSGQAGAESALDGG